MTSFKHTLETIGVYFDFALHEGNLPQIAIVYHSAFGHTEKQAEAVLDGAISISCVTAKLIKTSDAEAHWNYLAESDAVMFGCPTYMGSGSAEFKRFMDSTSKVWMSLGWRDKIAAGFTNSGSPNGDKLSTLFQLSLFAAQHAMIWVGMDVLPNTKNGSGLVLNRLGCFLGATAQSGNEPASITPGADDLATAKHLGIRVANIAKRMRSVS